MLRTSETRAKEMYGKILIHEQEMTKELERAREQKVVWKGLIDV